MPYAKQAHKRKTKTVCMLVPCLHLPIQESISNNLMCVEQRQRQKTWSQGRGAPSQADLPAGLTVC